MGLDFGATGYDYVGICFYGENSGGTMEIDNVSVVPEPASLALIAAGLLTLPARRRKSR